MTIPNRFKAIIFDMDGVLINSSDCHANAFRQVFNSIGIKNFHYPDYAGRRTTEVITSVFIHHGLKPDVNLIKHLAKQKTALALSFIRNKQPIFDGTTEMLKRLFPKFQLALASSASRQSVDLFLELSTSKSLFKTTLCGDDVAEAKPSPEIYITTSNRLSIEPSQCLVVEDAISGIDAALNAGMTVWSVTTTHTRNELITAGAHVVLKNAASLH
ncbi:HAD family hydrolase [Synoicihabitans lomoniglobus]|uniref:HAD family phosphatase n=1 Tax=Synoicihabitans lomoniglobus TaxID=2909285 RepID=A0AAF0CSR7_9BACT|nr:HAD family phosphatase [Opitutaceae bacterium LMO-M01]WED67370.1 HAD family phosphatase [Opitutaceae bacterium LMO-M01]